MHQHPKLTHKISMELIHFKAEPGTPPAEPSDIVTEPVVPESITPETSIPTLFGIGENGVPLFGRPGEAVWALLNLILAVIGVIVGIIVILRAMKKRRADEKEQAGYDVSEDEAEDRKQKRVRPAWLVCAAIIAAISVIVFLFTEDWTNPMVLLDRWTIVNAVCLLAEIISLRLAFPGKRDDQDEETDEDIVYAK